jgi:ferredoxin
VVRDLFLAFLAQHDDAAWLRIIDRIGPSIHPVDRIATRIWFHFYPQALQRAMERPDATDLARRMTLAGRWRLADQIDSSHAFLYGHRHWPLARRLALAFADAPASPATLDLGAQIQEAVRRGAAVDDPDPAVLLGITAIAFRTLQQVGPDALAASPGDLMAGGRYDGRSADEVLALRAGRVGAGWLRFLVGQRAQSEVTFNERLRGATFPLIASQHLTTAAALDRRQYRAADPRCSEGPIPVQCRSCSCGTCWVGVLWGAEQLSAIDARERDKLAECGIEVEGSHPPIRLACMSQAFGPVSLVIPPWNGLVGRVLKALA